MKQYSTPLIEQINLSTNERVAATICEKEGLLWVKVNNKWYAYEFSGPAWDSISQKALPGCSYGVYTDGLYIEPPS